VTFDFDRRLRLTFEFDCEEALPPSARPLPLPLPVSGGIRWFLVFVKTVKKITAAIQPAVAGHGPRGHTHTPARARRPDLTGLTVKTRKRT
jgi:hypothetical protein